MMKAIKKGAVRASESAMVRFCACKAPPGLPAAKSLLISGNSTVLAWNAEMAYTLTKGFFTNTVRLGFDSTNSRTSNRFRSDVAAGLGITGVSRDSFDWGLPSIDLTKFAGLRDIVTALRADRNFWFADALSWSHGKHNLKWGGEFRRVAFDLRRSNDARGSFVFTGFATAKLAGFMDMVFVVVESEKTDRDVVKRATALLAEAKANVGIVLNKACSYVPKQLQQEL